MAGTGSGELEIGTRIADRYTVVRRLGTGGMGVVFEVRGEDPSLRLALKLIQPHIDLDPWVIERFE